LEEKNKSQKKEFAFHMNVRLKAISTFSFLLTNFPKYVRLAKNKEDHSLKERRERWLKE
jgi:hypothetical protein